MLDAMGDHEYYSASYASKEEPHIDGLLHTLIDGVRRKEQDIAALRESGTDITEHDTVLVHFERDGLSPVVHTPSGTASASRVMPICAHWH